MQDREQVPLKLVIPVYRRDCWTCRYCGVRTIAPPVLRYLGLIYPGAFPYHPNWKSGITHRAWAMLSPTADHVQPGSKGGPWLDADNLVTACWICNAAKSDLTLDDLGWKLLGVDDVRSGWDGLTGAVMTLWELAGSPPNIFAEWRRELSRAT